jgi:hypothetical protein
VSRCEAVPPEACPERSRMVDFRRVGTTPSFFHSHFHHIVTNNLYSKSELREPEHVLKGSPSRPTARRSANIAANSRFRNILPLTHSGSRFCERATDISACNLMKKKLLAIRYEKK